MNTRRRTPSKFWRPTWSGSAQRASAALACCTVAYALAHATRYESGRELRRRLEDVLRLLRSLPWLLRQSFHVRGRGAPTGRGLRRARLGHGGHHRGAPARSRRGILGIAPGPPPTPCRKWRASGSGLGHGSTGLRARWVRLRRGTPPFAAGSWTRMPELDKKQAGLRFDRVLLTSLQQLVRIRTRRELYEPSTGGGSPAIPTASGRMCTGTRRPANST
jgi:hypothetical protein